MSRNELRRLPPSCAGLILLVASCAVPPPSGKRESEGTGTGNQPGLFPSSLYSPDAGSTDDRALGAGVARGDHSATLLLPDDLLDDPTPARVAKVAAAAQRARALGLGLLYWIEVGRSESLASQHPGWQASIQGPHPEWRRLHPHLAEAGPGEMVKVWPWVPVGYQESFAAHLERLRRTLVLLPPARAILLNHLQAAPSACGGGHTLCRWTTDYGPIHTAQPLGPEAAARFVDAVKTLAPGVEVIPVWTTECEEHDMAPGGRCGGVPCFDGTCWKALVKQLDPVLERTTRLGVQLFYKELGRDDAVYGGPAAWIQSAVSSLSRLPPLRGGTPVPPGRVVAVLQGWDTTPEEEAAQVAAARRAGVDGWIVARVKVSQEWEPRIGPAAP